MYKRRLRPLRENEVISSQVDEKLTIHSFSDAVRVHPGQDAEGRMFLYAPSTISEDYFIWFAFNQWVASAINRIVEAAAGAVLTVVRRDDEVHQFPQHKLLELLGEFGQPNDLQDSFEFFEQHYLNYELAGNSIWYWTSEAGAPDEVYVLDPRRVEVVPGRSSSISHYVYRTAMGDEKKIDPENITHWRRQNPFSRYWGLSVFEALRQTLRTDRAMSDWNEEFFGEDVAIPAGIVIVSPDTPEADMLRAEEEFNARHGQRRRTAFMRGTPGANSYIPAGAVHKDLDFESGRLLSRQSVYEALDLPLGLMSEASTEAHARVAERRFHEAVDRRLNRTSRKITSKVLHFWPAWKSYRAKFEDKRRDVDDWQQQQMKIETMLQTHSINEVRARVYNDPPVSWGEKEEEDANNGRLREAEERLEGSKTRRRESEAASSGPGEAAEQQSE